MSDKGGGKKKNIHNIKEVIDQRIKLTLIFPRPKPTAATHWQRSE